MSSSSSSPSLSLHAQSSLLVVIVDYDCQPMDPSAPRAPLLRAFADLVDSLEFFLNAYALSNRSCQIVVIYNSRDESRVIFPSKESDSDNISHDSIKVELNKLLVTNANSGSSSSSSSDGNKTEGAPICRAFSRALCLISRRVRRSAGRLRPRILVVQGTREHAIAFNSIMNSVFSANKLGVMIDALVLSLKESLFLQQACLITNGTYVSPQDNSANLLQTLLTNFIPNADLREVFERPIPRSIKMRASCYCHDKSVEFAYVCSLCLCIQCSDNMNQCINCSNPDCN